MKKYFFALGFLVMSLTSLVAQTTISIPNCTDCAPEISTLDCASATFNNTEFSSGEEFQASMMVPYIGGNGQPLLGLSVSSTGVTGLTADLVGGNLMSGAGNLIFYVHGTPSGAGTASFALSFLGQSCTVDLMLMEGVTTGTPLGSSAIGRGNYCNPLLSAIDVNVNHDETFILGPDSSLWIMTNDANGQLEGANLFFSVNEDKDWDNTPTNGRGQVKVGYPHRIAGPDYDRIKLGKIIYGDERILIGTTSTGESWAYTVATNTPPVAGSGVSTFFNHRSLVSLGLRSQPFGVGPSGSGSGTFAGSYADWYRLVTETGASIIKATCWSKDAQIMHFLDNEGKVWAGGSAVGSNSTNETRITGLGASYTPTATSAWAQLTIPNGDFIVDIATSAAPSLLNAFGVVVSNTGQLYWWGWPSANGPTTPQPLTMPNGTTAEAVYGNKSGVFIKGADGKLYFIGVEGGGQVSLVVPGMGTQMGTNTNGTVQEVMAWTNTGKMLKDVWTEAGNRDVFAISTDDKLYFAVQDGIMDFSDLDAPAPLGYTLVKRNDNFFLYDDEAQANLQYNTIRKVATINAAPGFINNSIFILTDQVLVYAGSYVNRMSNVNPLYNNLQGDNDGFQLSNRFPNVDFLKFCNGDYPLFRKNFSNIINPSTIYGLPNLQGVFGGGN